MGNRERRKKSHSGKHWGGKIPRAKTQKTIMSQNLKAFQE